MKNNIKYNDLLSGVPKTYSNINYEYYYDLFPQLIKLEKTPQDNYYHAEGDVWTHTKMVCDSLLQTVDYQNASDEDKFILFYSALLHDISKPDCTKTIDGKITSAGHSKRGAIDARIALWEMEVPFEKREAIANIINVHQLPFFALEGKKGGNNGMKEKTPEFIVHQLSCSLRLDLLIQIAKADMNGRFYEKKNESLIDIELFEEMCKEEGCFNTSKKFPDNITKVEYFRSMGDISPDYPFYKELKSKVVLLSGLPASGKDTWIKNNCADLEVLSYDDMKKDMGLEQSSNDGRAAHAVIERAKELLRTRTPFVWNATHLSKQMRGKALDLLLNYDADVDLVYLEQTKDVIMERNTNRNTSLTNGKIEQMLFKWEVPQAYEAHNVIYDINNEKNLKNKKRKAI